jgi:hypothetical protein
VTTTNALGVRAPAMMGNNHCLAGQGRTLALTEPHRRPGGASLRVGGCLGSLLVVALITAC